MPRNFFIIIFVQALLYIFLAWKHKKSLSVRELILSAVVGTIIGALFDCIISSLDLYTYIRDNDLPQAPPWNLTTTELLTNGALSFGLAVAAAKTLLKQKTEYLLKVRLWLLAIFISTTALSITSFFYLERGTLLLMFACGLFIVSLGECILLITKRAGPLAELITLTNISASLLLWLKIIFIGTVCEIINFFFPFWVWIPGGSLAQLPLTFIVTIFGYVAVLHPMIVFWRLREKH